MVIVAHVLASTERTNDPATDGSRWSKFIFTAQKGHDEALPLTSQKLHVWPKLGYSHSTSGKQWAFIYLRTHLFSLQRVWQPLHYTITYTLTARSVLLPLRYSTHSQSVLTSHNLLFLWRCSAMFSNNLSTTIRKWGGSFSQDEDELRFLVEAEKTVI